MNKTELLDVLQEFTTNTVAQLILPVKAQKNNPDPEPRAATVYKMRLPDSTSATMKAPYILHQVITGSDKQPAGQDVDSRATIRSVFVVYGDDESEGALHLLNLMERFRIELLKTVVLNSRYELDLEEGVDMMIYPDDTAPYFMGEMVTVWKLPPVRREVVYE